MKTFGGNRKLGILGGGQLGRMLLQKAADFNIPSAVLDPDPEAPCRHLTEHFVCGNFNDEQAVLDFGRAADMLTIEIEHVHAGALEQLEASGIAVYPQPRIIRLVQDKGLQKEFYRDHGIPTAGFVLAAGREELRGLSRAYPLVQKLRTGGYDGRGVKMIASPDQADAAFDAPCVLEDTVPFVKEVSVIVARSVHGEIRTFPPVEMEFNPEANLVEYLFAPADIRDTTAREADAVARRLAEALGIVGVLAVELFVLAGGEVLVNEIAPRPHNSGHHTIEANLTSQYEQHLRAILGFPLGHTDLLKPAVMVNLLGEKGYNGPAQYEGMEEVMAIDGAKVHLYGKKVTKPFRKMGHVTVVGDSLAEARMKARKIKDTLRIIA
jgi:5-(carboxyamino)imidazole ribonucleotide synthase